MKFISFLILFLTCCGALAGQQPDSKKPGLFAGQRSESSAVVAAIDQESREVTLRHQDGTTTTFVAGPEVRNLAQVSVGDILHVEYSQTVRIQVAGAKDAGPTAGAVSAMTRAEEGEMPGMATVDSKVIIAKVVAIDVPGMTYKLQFPDGTVNEYKALVKENLEAADVGDVVAIEVTESVIAYVEDADGGQ